MIETICGIFHAKPMFPLELDIHGTWLTIGVAAGNPQLQEIKSVCRK